MRDDSADFVREGGGMSDEPVKAKKRGPRSCKVGCKCNKHSANHPICPADCKCRRHISRTGKQNGMWQHGESQTRAYRTWKLMKWRCCSSKAHGYHRYGGRGIKVCKRWAESFADFLQDMGQPGVGQTIDRINNDGDYEPGNCRWASAIEQQRNKTGLHLLTAFGETHPITTWSRDARCKVEMNTLGSRVRNGWPVIDAITTPSRGRKAKAIC